MMFFQRFSLVKYKLIMLFGLPLVSFLSISVMNVAQYHQSANEMKQMQRIVEFSRDLQPIFYMATEARSSSLSVLSKRTPSSQFTVENSRRQQVFDEFKEKINRFDFSGYDSELVVELKKSLVESSEKLESLVMSPSLLKRNEVEVFGKTSREVFAFIWGASSIGQAIHNEGVSRQFIVWLSGLKMYNSMSSVQAYSQVVGQRRKFKTPQEALRLQKPLIAAQALQGYMQQLSKTAEKQLLADYWSADEPVMVRKTLNQLSRVPASVQFKDNIDFNRFYSANETYLQEMRVMIQKFRDILDTKTESELARYQNARNMWLVLSVILLAVTLLMGWFIITRILGSLTEVKTALTELASGDGDLTFRIKTEKNDEFAELAAAVNQFTANVERIVLDVNQSVEDISVVSRDTLSLTDNNQNAVENQQLNLNSVSSAVQEMAVTSNQIAENAVSAAESAKASNEQLSYCNQRILDNADVMTEVIDSINRAALDVSKLEKSTTDIHAILSTIGNIAEQTNLLALNAAIEAARAGEQGRGFSVVADEVRQLAHRTQDSTAEIAQMLQTFSEVTNTVVTQINDSVKLSSSGHVTVEEALASLKEMTSAIEMINDLNDQIATATHQQSVVCNDVSERVVDIDQESASLGKNSSAILSLGKQLNQLASEQHQVVSKFKVSSHSLR